MAKNMTRKSLAVASAGLLAAASLVGATPAMAAGELKIEPASGELFAVPHGVDIVLATSVTTGNSSDELQFLHYKFETSGSLEVFADADDDIANAATTGASTKVVAADETSDVTPQTNWDSTEAVAYVGVFVEDADSNGFEQSADTQSVTVTAFIDKDGDDKVDAGEWQVSQVVQFMDEDDTAVTTVLTAPALGDTTVEAVVTSTNINLDQSSSKLSVDFSDNPSSSAAKTTDGADGAETDSSGTYDGGELTFETGEFTTTGTSVTTQVPSQSNTGDAKLTVVAGTVTAQLQVGTYDVGIASTRSVSTTTVDTVVAAAAAGAHNKSLNTNNVDSRAGSGSLTVKYTVADSASAAVEDKTVTLTLEENAVNSLDSDASVSVGGATLTNADAAKVEKVTATAVSDVDGEVQFVISWSGVDKADVLKITAKVDGRSSGADTINFEDTAAGAIYNLDVTGTTSSELYYAKNESFSLRYSLVDQFGALFTGLNHSVQVSDTAVTNSAVFSNGYATVDFAGYAATGAKTMTATAFKGGATTGKTTTTEVTIASAAQKAVATVSIAETDSFGSSSSKKALMLKDWNDADVRIGQAAPTVQNGLTATATITDVDGNTTRGPITFSGANLLFRDANSQVYSAGSITVQSSTTGTAAVEVYSNTAGTHTLTVTSGGVSKTDLMYFQSAKEDTGTTITVDAPSSAKPGSTFNVVFTLTDKYGNPVTTDSNATNYLAGSKTDKFSVTFDGAGLYMGSLPTSTDSNGQAKVSVLLGSNDSGSTTITATYDGDTASTTNTTVATSTAVVNDAAAQKVNAGSFKGYVAVYARGYEGQRLSAKVGKDWVIVDPIVNNQEDGTLHRTVEFTGAGVDIAVRIYIDRVLVDTINLTTK